MSRIAAAARGCCGVFGRHDCLPVGGAVLIGEAGRDHGLRLYLYEISG